VLAERRWLRSSSISLNENTGLFQASETPAKHDRRGHATDETNSLEPQSTQPTARRYAELRAFPLLSVLQRKQTAAARREPGGYGRMFSTARRTGIHPSVNAETTSEHASVGVLNNPIRLIRLSVCQSVKCITPHVTIRYSPLTSR